MDLSLNRRPRRLRRTEGIRAMVRETRVELDGLIQPLFVLEPGKEDEGIASMPGQYRRSLENTLLYARRLAAHGVRGVAPFPVIASGKKTPDGREALNTGSLILETIRALKSEVPELMVFADIALDPYTSHGHDGVLTAAGNDVDNDETVARLVEMALLHARAGVDFVAPSDMMDGRVGAIREALDSHGYEQVGLLAYAAKFNSAYYGPFREAVGSSRAAGTPNLSKATYQLDPANRREALLECYLDEMEGADVLMVKPAGPYLDIIRELRGRTDLPVAAYQVSGEYAQIHAAAQLGWLDYDRTRDESLLAIRRAGADWIITYFAAELALGLSGGRVGRSEETAHEAGERSYSEADGI